MAFKKGQSGNPGGRGTEKIWREAIMRAVHRVADKKSPAKALDKLADVMVAAGLAGDLTAIKELGDRIDGKPAQAIIGGDDDQPGIKFQALEIRIVDPQS